MRYVENLSKQGNSLIDNPVLNNSIINNPRRTIKNIVVILDDNKKIIFNSQKDFCIYFKCSQVSASKWLLKKSIPSKRYKIKDLNYI